IDILVPMLGEMTKLIEQSSQEIFVTSKWRADKSARALMIDDLLTHFSIEGMNTERLTDLLGPPDREITSDIPCTHQARLKIIYETPGESESGLQINIGDERTVCCYQFSMDGAI